MLDLIKRVCGMESGAALWDKSERARIKGRRAEQHAIYQRLARRRPRSAQDHLYAGWSESRLGNPAAAIERFEAGLERYPQAGELRKHHARICIRQGQIERLAHRAGITVGGAEQICTALFELPYIDAAARLDLSEWCIRNGWHGLALTQLKLLKADCSDPARLWRIASNFEACGDHDEAEGLHRSLSELQHTTAEVFHYAARLEQRRGKLGRALDILERGQVAHPEAADLRALYVRLCGEQDDFSRLAAFEAGREASRTARILTRHGFYSALLDAGMFEVLVRRYRDIESCCTQAELTSLQDQMLSVLGRDGVEPAMAKRLVFHARLLDVDGAFAGKLLDRLLSLLERDHPDAAGEREALHVLDALTPPILPYSQASAEHLTGRFIQACKAMRLRGPDIGRSIEDMRNVWAPWHALFFSGQPAQYPEAMAALEPVLHGLWPQLGFTAPHVEQAIDPRATADRRIRVGFIVYDAMPMMSGLAARLDKDRFETFYLRPGRQGTMRSAIDWPTRVDHTIEYPAFDVAGAIDAIAGQRLDIIVSGPSMGGVFLPVLARLAPLQMVLLEPDWINGTRNADYYVSWKAAEPDRPQDFYANAVAFLECPPYWIERPEFSVDLPLSPTLRSEIRQRLLGRDEGVRVYLCAGFPPKVHADMDEMFAQLLERDPCAIVVLLRSETLHAPSLKARLRSRLGEAFDRIVLLPRLSSEDAHALLLAADCNLDTFPICGMSSSIDALMLGVPTVTLPHDVPFGRWTAALYEYIGVEGLTAGSREDYLQIALRLASDAQWRDEKGVEIQRKASRYVENEASSAAFENFLLDAWERRLAGREPANWLDGAWSARPPR